MLSITEKIILSSIDENKSKFSIRAYNFYNYGVKGAAILKLAAGNNIKIESKKIIVTDESPVDDSIFDSVLQHLKSIGRPIRLDSWFYSYYRFNRTLKIQVLNNLEAKGIIMQDERRFLGLIPYKKYNIINSYVKQAIKSDVREILLKESSDVNDETAVLISLATVCGGLRMFLDRNEMRQIRSKITRIKKGEYFIGLNDDLKLVLKSIQNAIAAQAAATGV